MKEPNTTMVASRQNRLGQGGEARERRQSARRDDLIEHKETD